jgi:hypothetical protein
MGEAKRRGGSRPSGPAIHDRLPHLIFGRNKTAEREGGFKLASRFVTDIEKDDEEGLTRDKPLIDHIIGTLIEEVKRDPDLQWAGVWRDPNNKPEDGYALPYPDGPMKARIDRCIMFEVRIDPGGTWQ